MTTKYNFCFWLVDNLLQRNMTLFEIKSKWKNSSYNKKAELLTDRTFARYKTDVQSLLDVVINCDKKDGNRYFIENKDEIVTNKIYSWLLMSHKINHVSKKITNHKNVVLESAPPGSNYLAIILEAIETHKLLTVSYKSHYKDLKRVIFKPSFLKLSSYRWYMIGIVIGTNEERTYALERIMNVSIFSAENECALGNIILPDPETYFEHCVGVIKMHDPIDIHFRAFWPQNEYLKGVPIHSSQEVIQENDQFSDFRVYVRPTYDLKQQFLWHRDKLLILEPLEFKQDMIKIIENMLKSYKSSLPFLINE